MKGFIEFVREQGVVGLAIGFILGGAIQKVVSALVTDIINPILGILLGSVGSFENASLMVAGAQIMYGDFIGVLIDFMVIALVVYFVFKQLAEKVDKKK